MSTTNRNVALAYLRTFLTLLVVAHHAVLAYYPYAPPRPQQLGESLAWAAFPVVDDARWPGIELFVSFNDAFFMSLMFLVSGVFAWAGLERKGRARFVQERVRKLGTAFVFAAALLAPLAYFPAYLTLAPQSTSFVRQWLSLGSWPAGPAWFLWVLIAFACVAALGHPLLRRVYPALGRLGERPVVAFAALVALAAVAYLPLAAAFGSFHWWSVGPFFVQSSRVVLYAVFFLAGIALGAYGTQLGLLARDGRLARRWPLWTGGALLAFGANLVAFVVGVLPTLATGGPGPLASAVSHFAFVLSCATTSFASIALFVRFARRPKRVLDSLDANAFGIYLLHYACVSWLQWSLLGVALPGAAKGSLVFLGAVLVSWGLSAAGRWIWSSRRPATQSSYSPAAAV